MTLDSLRAELRKLSAPHPPSDLLARILASRAKGARVILPTARGTGQGLRSARVAAAYAVAPWASRHWAWCSCPRR